MPPARPFINTFDGNENELLRLADAHAYIYWAASRAVHTLHTACHAQDRYCECAARAGTNTLRTWTSGVNTQANTHTAHTYTAPTARTVAVAKPHSLTCGVVRCNGCFDHKCLLIVLLLFFSSLILGGNAYKTHTTSRKLLHLPMRSWAYLRLFVLVCFLDIHTAGEKIELLFICLCATRIL